VGLPPHSTGLGLGAVPVRLSFRPTGRLQRGRQTAVELSSATAPPPRPRGPPFASGQRPRGSDLVPSLRRASSSYRSSSVAGPFVTAVTAFMYGEQLISSWIGGETEKFVVLFFPIHFEQGPGRLADGCDR
jgi:hypothetical protein